MPTDPRKLYDRLKPPERLTLTLEALARNDEEEAGRVRGSCPRSTYSGPDAAFDDRWSVAFDIAAVVTIDLRCMWGKLHVLHWVIADVMPDLATALLVTAGLGFVEGERSGQGQPQMDFFARPLPEPAPADDAGDEDEDDGGGGEAGDDDDEADNGDVGDAAVDDTDEEEEQGEALPRDLERGRRLDAVQRRAEHFTAGGMAALLLAAKDIAQDLVDTWAAFGAFCRTRVGVTPETMLGAWGFPVLGEFQDMLAHYAGLEPDRQKVRQYSGYMCTPWDRRFGRRRGADEQEDGESDGE